jgi:excisionase family DNA binding protein
MEVTAEQVPAPSPWLAPAQAAEYLGLSIRHLRELRAEDAGPAFRRLSRQTVRYHRADLDAWMDDQTVRPAGRERKR